MLVDPKEKVGAVVFPIEAGLTEKLAEVGALVASSLLEETCSIGEIEEVMVDVGCPLAILKVTCFVGDFLFDVDFKIGTTGDVIGDVFTLVVVVEELKVVRTAEASLEAGSLISSA